MELYYRRVRSLYILRADILGVNPCATNSGEPQMEALREVRFQWVRLQLYLRVQSRNLGQSLVPVVIEVVGAWVAALVLVELFQRHIYERHRTEKFTSINHVPCYNETMSVLIRGGQVIDGTGARALRADVRVQGDKIAVIKPNLKPESGETTIDAGGRVIAPGFIDAHSHADGGIFDDLNAETQLRQGITTSVVGQDGGHNYPLSNWL